MISCSIVLIAVKQFNVYVNHNRRQTVSISLSISFCQCKCSLNCWLKPEGRLLLFLLLFPCFALSLILFSAFFSLTENWHHHFQVPTHSQVSVSLSHTHIWRLSHGTELIIGSKMRLLRVWLHWESLSARMGTRPLRVRELVCVSSTELCLQETLVSLCSRHRWF